MGYSPANDGSGGMLDVIKSVVRKNKKQFLIVVGVLFGIILAIAGNHIAHANGLTGEELTGDYLFNKYPIENYMLDSYVDTSGNWMPWNWGDAVDDGIFSVLTFLIGSLYVSIFRFFSVIGYFVQMIYSTDLVNTLADMVVSYVQGVSGFNGEFTENGLFTEFLVTIVIIAGIYYGFKVLKKESGEAINGVMVFGLLIAVSLGFFLKADYFINGANNIAMSVQTAVVGAGTNALGMAGDPGTAIRESFFDVTVYQPYLLLQYDDNTVSQEDADKILSLESGSEDREKLVKEQVEAGNQMMNGWYGLNLRMSNMLPLVLSGAVLAIVILVMVCINIYHQLAFLLYVCFSPFVLITSLIPGRSSSAVKLAGKIFYELCMRVALAMLLSIMCGFSTAVFSVTGAEGYIFGAVLQAIIYVAIFLFRKKIYRLFETSMTPKQGGGFRSAVGTFYMANRGFKSLGHFMGMDSKDSESKTRRKKPKEAEETAFSERKKNTNRSNVERSQQEKEKGAYAERDKISAPRKGVQQSARARTVKQAAQVAKNGGIAGSFVRTGVEKNKQNRQNRQSGKNAYSVNAGKYRTVRKEEIPRIRQAEWKKQTQGDMLSLERRRINGDVGSQKGGSKNTDNKAGKEYTIRQKIQKEQQNSRSNNANSRSQEQSAKNNTYNGNASSAKYTVRDKKNMVSGKKEKTKVEPGTFKKKWFC